MDWWAQTPALARVERVREDLDMDCPIAEFFARDVALGRKILEGMGRFHSREPMHRVG